MWMFTGEENVAVCCELSVTFIGYVMVNEACWNCFVHDWLSARGKQILDVKNVIANLDWNSSVNSIWPCAPIVWTSLLAEGYAFRALPVLSQSAETNFWLLQRDSVRSFFGIHSRFRGVLLFATVTCKFLALFVWFVWTNNLLSGRWLALGKMWLVGDIEPEKG